MSTNMVEELTAVLDHLTVKARESQAAAEEAHIVADEARQLLRAVSILGKGRQSDILRHSVTLECGNPTLSWTPQSIDIDAEIELSNGQLTTLVTLSNYTVDLDGELDGLQPDSAEVEFSVQHMLEVIGETIMDYANGDDETEAAIAAIANELRNIL
jgi:hypothetical protein